MKTFASFVALAFAFSSSAFAIPGQSQAHLSFTGGDDTPLTITLESSLRFDLYESQASAEGFMVLFVDVAEVIEPMSDPLASSNVTFSLNGSALPPVDHAALTPFDENPMMELAVLNMALVQENSFPQLIAGDSLILSAGTMATSFMVASSSLPADGFYDVYLVNQQGVPIPATITAVPEPSTYALIAGGMVFAGVMIRRFKKRNKAA